MVTINYIRMLVTVDGLFCATLLLSSSGWKGTTLSLIASMPHVNINIETTIVVYFFLVLI